MLALALAQAPSSCRLTVQCDDGVVGGQLHANGHALELGGREAADEAICAVVQLQHAQHLPDKRAALRRRDARRQAQRRREIQRLADLHVVR